jgi:hypothetical protein
MATHKSDIILAKENRNVSEKAALEGVKTGATVLRATAVYTMKGTEAATDTIHLTDLPPSAVVLPHDSSVSFGYTRGFYSGTLYLGDQHDPYRYGSAYLNHDGHHPISAPFGYKNNGRGVDPAPYDKTTRLTATFAGTPISPVAGSKLIFGINYAIKG